MVVVVIVAIATGIAIPAFVGSFRGAKLKVATRSVTMATRLARSTAVLQNQQMAILFFPDHGEIELVRLKTKLGHGQQSMFMEGRDTRRVEGMIDDEAQGDPSAALGGVESEMVRPLPDGVRIAEVRVQRADNELKGAYWVNFYPNGMSDKYELVLADDTDRRATVKVNPISGKVSISYER